MKWVFFRTFIMGSPAGSPSQRQTLSVKVRLLPNFVMDYHARSNEVQQKPYPHKWVLAETSSSQWLEPKLNDAASSIYACVKLGDKSSNALLSPAIPSLLGGLDIRAELHHNNTRLCRLTNSELTEEVLTHGRRSAN
ncbi:MAG: hypothetical protein ACK4I8_06825 [Armatimonadota bacterium]